MYIREVGGYAPDRVWLPQERLTLKMNRVGVGEGQRTVKHPQLLVGCDVNVEAHKAIQDIWILNARCDQIFSGLNARWHHCQQHRFLLIDIERLQEYSSYLA
jgi:hypothetical protein